MKKTTTVPRNDGRDLAVCEWGAADGSPLFWLHGTPGSRLLRHPEDQYARAGLRVLTYDRPGYGESTRAPGRTVADTAADVTAIADAWGIARFGVAGVSGGGPHALAVAALAPERVTCCAVVVAGPPMDADGLDYLADLDAENREFYLKLRDRDVDFLLSELEDTAAWVRSGMPELGSLPPDDRQMLLEAFSEAVRPGPWGFVDDLLAESLPWGFSVEDVAVPTRVMLARGDTSVPPSHAAWLEQRLPHGRVVWVGGDHFGPRDKEEMELMSWVGGTRAG